MKKFAMAFLLTLSLSCLYGCAAPAMPKADAPLQTEGTTSPPPGCQDLRQRGGAC